MLRRDPCVAADLNGPTTTRHRGARCHAGLQSGASELPTQSSSGGLQRLLLGFEIGGRWNEAAPAARQSAFEPNGPRRHCEPQPDGGGRLWGAAGSGSRSPWPASPHASQ